MHNMQNMQNIQNMCIIEYVFGRAQSFYIEYYKIQEWTIIGLHLWEVYFPVFSFVTILVFEFFHN